jgi:YgiT-type zinc finger domain-containing protein
MMPVSGCHHRIPAQREAMDTGLANSEEGIDMECLYCTGTLVRDRVSYTATRKGYHLIIDDVPAWVCEQCGEPLFEEETVEAIQQVLQGLDAHLEESALLFAAT